METFTPIAMKCTQEQFDAIKPKLTDCESHDVTEFNICEYLVNNLGSERKLISNVMDHAKGNLFRTVHETWNEEIFLKSCGIEVESLEQQLQKAEAEVKRLQSLIDEENKIKIGDWVINEYGVIWRCKELDSRHLLNKITNPELIKLLNNEIK